MFLVMEPDNDNRSFKSVTKFMNFCFLVLNYFIVFILKIVISYVKHAIVYLNLIERFDKKKNKLIGFSKLSQF